ncbi:MAG: hypothetical protein ACE5HD_08280 [Acidobacteriota bacterium]
MTGWRLVAASAMVAVSVAGPGQRLASVEKPETRSSQAAVPELGERAPREFPEERPMQTTNARLEIFLRGLEVPFDGGDGRWAFEYEGVQMLMISDEPHDRMRIIAPVVEAGDLPEKTLRVLMEANFDRALDAKYAIYRDTVWSTYVHPLGALTRGEFGSALRQVATLRKTYGGSFTSTDLVFGNSGE